MSELRQTSPTMFWSSLFSELIWAPIGAIIGGVVSLYAESKFNLTQWLRRKKHWIINSEAGFKLHVIAEGEHNFTEVKADFKDNFRDGYSEIDVHTDTANNLEMTVGEDFILNISSSSDSITVQTDRIDSTVRTLEKNSELVIDSIVESIIDMEVSEYTATLYLPYLEKMVSQSISGNFEVEDYEYNVLHRDYKSSVSLNSEKLSIHADKLKDLERTISKFA